MMHKTIVAILSLLFAVMMHDSEMRAFAQEAVKKEVSGEDSVEVSADEPGSIPENPGKLPLQMALTTSGGVSLGAYQAGYLYYLTEVAKLNPELFETKIITGASAGTINALIMAIALGNDLQSAPSRSLFFRLWTELNINDLLDVTEAPPLALSSRKVFEDLADSMELAWNEGLHKDLDIVIGASTTRVNSRKIAISKSFEVPRQEEKFVFRIRGRGKGMLPLVTNYVDRSHGIAQPLLPFVDPSDVEKEWTNFSVLKKVMFASSAFPLAFPSQEIEYCMTVPELEKSVDSNAFTTCRKPSRKALFVDGSMFDRNPLGLAHRIMVSGLEHRDGRYVFKDAPRKVSSEMPASAVLLYVDALNESYPSQDDTTDAKSVEALFPAFGSYSQGFVRSSQARGLHFLVDEYPSVRDRIELTTRNFPSASGLLANFFGFFDSKFRVFDFYLGMYDAHDYMRKEVTRAVGRLTEQKVDIRFPENTQSARREESWKPYECMRNVFDGEARYDGSCAGDQHRDFRILLQIALNRLYNQCRDLPMDETLGHVHCVNAMGGKQPPVVEKMVDGDFENDWARKGDELRFQYTMRLLEYYQFWFADLGLDRDDAWEAMSRIREILAGALDDYAQKLPRAESIAIRVVGKPALNFFKYQPPQVIVYAGAGKGAEFGLSAAGRYSPSRWIRFNLAMQLKGLYELMGPEENLFAMTPLAGVEIENIRWANPVFQGRLGLRLGYQFSTGDGFLSGSCDTESLLNDDRECSAPVAQAFLVFTFYERIRLQGGVEWFPYFLPPMNEQKENLWNGFIEIGWQWISPFKSRRR